MRVYKRKESGVYQIEISTPDGKKRFSSKTALKREAIAIATYHQQSINDSISYGRARTVSMKEAADAYLDDMRLNRSSTYKTAVFNVRHLLDGTMWTPETRWESVTSLQILKFQKIKAKVLSNNSVNHFTTALTTMLTRSELWEISPPTFKVKKLKVVPKFRYLREGEEEKLLEVMKEQDLKDLTIFLIDTGMRICEAVETMWTDRTFENGIGCFVTYRGKTGVRSLLPITERLKAILERREQGSISLYVFPHKTKIGGHRTTSSKGILQAAKRAGLNAPEIVSKLGKFTAHSCRDTYATRLVKAGMTLYEVQTMLGHVSPIMTQKYAHLSTGDIGSKVLRALA